MCVPCWEADMFDNIVLKTHAESARVGTTRGNPFFAKPKKKANYLREFYGSVELKDFTKQHKEFLKRKSQGTKLQQHQAQTSRISLFWKDKIKATGDGLEQKVPEVRLRLKYSSIHKQIVSMLVRTSERLSRRRQRNTCASILFATNAEPLL